MGRGVVGGEVSVMLRGLEWVERIAGTVACSPHPVLPFGRGGCSVVALFFGFGSVVRPRCDGVGC